MGTSAFHNAEVYDELHSTGVFNAVHEGMKTSLCRLLRRRGAGLSHNIDLSRMKTGKGTRIKGDIPICRGAYGHT